MANFCGKCGRPTSDCTCGGRSVVIGGGGARPELEPPRRTSSSYVERFSNIAMSDGEIPIRNYAIGVMKTFGSGSTHVFVTNRRVIMRSESNYLLMSTNTLNEVAIESVTGVNNHFAKGFKKLYLIWGAILMVLGLGLLNFSSGGNSSYGYGYRSSLPGGAILPIVVLALGVLLLIFSRRPTYIFGLTTAAAGQALSTNINVTGVHLSRHGTGIVFTFKPTEDVITMMQELGACIMDIKAKGDHAIPAWKNI